MIAVIERHEYIGSGCTFTTIVETDEIRVQSSDEIGTYIKVRDRGDYEHFTGQVCIYNENGYLVKQISSPLLNNGE
jgi:hypothetical protein